MADILSPQCGRYYFIAPDKRYCFDRFMPGSTVAAVIAAHDEKRTAHMRRSVIEHRALTTHNHPIAHWRGNRGERYPRDQADRILAAIDGYRGTDSYLNVHA